MRFLKLFIAVGLVLSLGACSCRTRKVSAASDNLPVVDNSVLKDVNFSFDSYALDTTARAILEQNARWLTENASATVQIEGHCDERGTNEYNMALGANRAKSANDYLRSLGVAANRLSTVSYGEELPLDPGHNDVAWAKNRRAHFNVQR